MQYPKCKHCKHSRTKHIDKYNGTKLTTSFCWDCYNCFTHGPTYEWEYDLSPDEYTKMTANYSHNYHPDNLTFIEKLAERRGLV